MNCLRGIIIPLPRVLSNTGRGSTRKSVSERNPSDINARESEGNEANTMAFSKTIQMYIFDGNPNGRIMCELSNWNGRIYKISRNELSEFAKRMDSENTGVYFLFGKDESNFDTIYVGEAEKCAHVSNSISKKIIGTNVLQ